MREALKKDEFDHVLKKMDYDQKVFEIWKKKVGTVQGARLHAKQEHLVTEHRRVAETVESYIDGCFRFLSWEDAKNSESLLPQILSYRMEALKKIRTVPASACDVPTVVIMNWTAPCLFASSRQKDHSNVLAWALHDNQQSVGVIFFPTFSYSRGKTSLEETAALNSLVTGGHNLDHQFSLLYAERNDQRDSRPLLYPARFAFPGHILDLSKNNMFWNCELRKNGRTDPVKQLPSKDLKEVEDISEEALPQSCSTGFVSGAAKHCQLGPPAAEEVLKKLFAGVDLGQVPALLVLDLFPRVSDFCHAFAKLRTSLSDGASLFYCAVGEKSKELDWLRLTLVEDLTDKMKAGNMVIPGSRAFQSEVAPDLLESLPALPIMNLLVTQGDGEFRKLVIPKKLVEKWASDPDFGEQFTRWLDKFLENYSVGDDPAEAGASGAKRGAEEQSGSAGSTETPLPSPKKLKVAEVAAECIVDNDKVQEALLVDCKLGGKDTLNFQLRTGHFVYLVNLTAAEITLKPLTALVGFGRGGFKMYKAEETVSEKAIPFEVTSSDMLVSLNGVVGPISDVLLKQRQTKPEAGVCYHEVALDPEKIGSFNFKRKHPVYFVPSGPTQRGAGGEGGESKEETLSSSNIGSRESLKTWMGLQQACLVWSVKWTLKGLQPVKPMVHISKKLTLPPGKSCKLN